MKLQYCQEIKSLLSGDGLRMVRYFGSFSIVLAFARLNAIVKSDFTFFFQENVGLDYYCRTLRNRIGIWDFLLAVSAERCRCRIEKKLESSE